MKFMTPSDYKYPYETYYQLFNSSGVSPTSYLEAVPLGVMPRLNNGPGFNLEQHTNTYNVDNRYPGFLRFESTTPETFNYVLQEN